MTGAPKQKDLFRRIKVPPLVFPRPQSAIEADRLEDLKKHRQDFYIKPADNGVK